MEVLICFEDERCFFILFGFFFFFFFFCCFFEERDPYLVDGLESMAEKFLEGLQS